MPILVHTGKYIKTVCSGQNRGYSSVHWFKCLSTIYWILICNYNYLTWISTFV